MTGPTKCIRALFQSKTLNKLVHLGVQQQLAMLGSEAGACDASKYKYNSSPAMKSNKIPTAVTFLHACSAFVKAGKNIFGHSVNPT